MQAIHNLAQMFHRQAQELADKKVMLVKRQGRFRHIRWRTLQRQVNNTAKGLLTLHLKKQEMVAILAENSPRWVIADLGILSAGGVSVPIYATNTPDQVAYILKDCGARFVFVSTEAQLQKVLKVAGELPNLKKIISFRPVELDDERVITLEQLSEMGEGMDIVEVQGRTEATGREDLATLIYTSGTTGEPKGVMLTHGNLLSNLESVEAVLPDLSGDDLQLSFLPLSHSFERLAGYYLPLSQGVPIAYAEAMDTVAEDMQKVRPTVMTSVPRLYEKFYARIQEGLEQKSQMERALFHWAVDVGKQRVERRMNHELPDPFVEFQFTFARILVFNKIKERVGGRLKYFVSGGAPLSQEIAEFFHAVGLPILEGYGLTETSPVLTCNRPDDFRLGTVGKPVPGVEIKIAEDGEILAKGPNIMRGYFNKAEATAEALEGGWYHTGDIGELRDGFLVITDRKKDLIITAGGKNVAPQHVEGLLALDPLVDQVCVIGDRRKYLSALIVPAFDTLKAWAKVQGVTTEDNEALVKDRKVEEKFREIVENVNKGLPSYETLKRFTLVPQPFSQETGELTPTLKIKRRVVTSKYYAQIEEMYDDE